METQVTRPLRRDAELNRQRVIRAAREVFAQRGLGASLDDVAHHAGVGVGTVYRRFPDREALIGAAMREVLEDVLAVLAESLEMASGWDGLTTFLRQATRMHEADRGLRDLVLTDGHGHMELEGLRGRFEPLVAELVHRAQDEGALRPDVTPADLILVQVMVSVVGSQGAPMSSAASSRCLELIIDGLRAGGDKGDLGPAPTEDDVLRVAEGVLPGLGRRHSTPHGG